MHKVEMRVKETGEQEEELVVSNLRPFVLKARARQPPTPQTARVPPSLVPAAPALTARPAQVGVLDALDQPDVNFSLPLRAALLYENGLPVKQTSSSGAAREESRAPPALLRSCSPSLLLARSPFLSIHLPSLLPSEPLLVGETDVVALQGAPLPC